MPHDARTNAVIFLAVIPTALCAQLPAPRAREEAQVRLEAINLLQGADSLPFLDTARVQIVEAALQSIRQRLPQVSGISAGRDRSYLVLWAPDSAEGVFVERSKARRPAGADADFWRVPLRRAGIRAIDSLNHVFDVARMEVRYLVGLTELALYFRRPVNLPVVARAYMRVREVDHAGSETYMGDGSWIALRSKGTRLHFVFARGGGDCPAGCTEWDYHYVTYDTRDSSIALEHQLLSGTQWSEPIFYWDIPTRYSINPYPTVDSLYAGLRERRWWYREHAVYVLGILLGKETSPWHGAGEQSAARFTALKQAALARRSESYGALVERLNDPDPDVARLALGYLRELSGRDYSGGAAGIPRWRQWLGESR